MDLINWDALFDKYNSIKKINEDIASNKRGVTESLRMSRISELSEAMLIASKNIQKDLDNHLFLKKIDRTSKNEKFFNSITTLRRNKLTTA